jgi:hypothetical protein
MCMNIHCGDREDPAVVHLRARLLSVVTSRGVDITDTEWVPHLESSSKRLRYDYLVTHLARSGLGSQIVPCGHVRLAAK